MARIVPDASLLTHALIESQSVAETRRVFWGAYAHRNTQWFMPSSVLFEWSSYLRKSVNRKFFAQDEAEELFLLIQELPGMSSIPASGPLLKRAWEIATRFGQSDIFDSFGLAVAEEFDGVFWTSDLRFYNVVSAAFGPERIQYFP